MCCVVIPVCFFSYIKMADYFFASSSVKTILLLGKTGSGKSASGNTILQDRIFKTSLGFESVTKGLNSAVSSCEDYIFKVFDLPGFADTNTGVNFTEEDCITSITDQINKAFIANSAGFDVLLYVIRSDVRFTDEDYHMFKSVRLLLGQNALREYGILLLTFWEKDDTQPVIKWCLEQKSDHFQELFSEFGEERIVAFNNRTKDTDEKIQQLKVFTDVLSKLQKNNKYKRYTKEEYEICRLNHLCLQVIKLKDPTNKIVAEKLTTLKKHLLISDIQFFYDFKNVAEHDIKELKKQDQRTNVLTENISDLQTIIEIVVCKVSHLKKKQSNQESLEMKAAVNKLEYLIQKYENLGYKFRELNRTTISKPKFGLLSKIHAFFNRNKH